MSMLFELVSLALKPLLLAKLSCQIGARSISIIVVAWIEVLRFVLGVHLIVLCRVAVWAIAGLTLPIRAFVALYRERLLVVQIYRLENELGNTTRDRKELREKLHVATKERRMMEMMLMELEEEHDEAILKIGTLTGEVRDLKDEIQRLKENHYKAISAYKSRDHVLDGCDHLITDNIVKPPTAGSSKDPARKDTGSKIYVISDERDFVVAKQRNVALSRSIFSAMLSLTVGFVLWEAKSPCMPLVVALFTVVAMSLTSVMGLFGKIERKPTSDVVALMSLNWFVLGMLTCPMLPGMGRLLAPLTSSFSRRMFS